MQASTDKEMNLGIGKLLRYGVVFSAVLVAFGGILSLQHPLRPAMKYNHFIANGTAHHGVAGVLRGAAHLDPNGVVQLGVLLLIATPVARVAFCIAGFARQKDLLYIVISSSVLAILIYSLIQGAR